MSFIVKGIDLPKDKDCINLSIYSNGDIYEQAENGFYFRINADAVQISKSHGRIIDADNIDYDDFWHRKGQGFTIAVCQGAQRIIEEQPTILKAGE